MLRRSGLGARVLSSDHYHRLKLPLPQALWRTVTSLLLRERQSGCRRIVRRDLRVFGSAEWPPRRRRVSCIGQFAPERSIMREVSSVSVLWTPERPLRASSGVSVTYVEDKRHPTAV